MYAEYPESGYALTLSPRILLWWADILSMNIRALASGP